ncbi:MAG: hypothetical protein Q8K65_11555 [Alphaproteobacteria bacterium]|nr:hypothetical protein [Alphaproteobacteria bacterium]
MMYLDFLGMIMFQRQLRKEFTRALCKATLMALLPLSLATASLASAQEVDGNRAVPIPTEQTVTQDVLLLQEGKAITVEPETEISVESVEARYPFMKTTMDYLREVNKLREEDLLARTTIMISTVRDVEKKTDIAILSVTGPLTCGSSQCHVGIFIDKGEGYKEAFSGAAPLPVTILKQNDELSFFFCSYTGRAQWTLNGDVLEHQGNVRFPQTGPSCQSE